MQLHRTGSDLLHSPRALRELLVSDEKLRQRRPSLLVILKFTGVQEVAQRRALVHPDVNCFLPIRGRMENGSAGKIGDCASDRAGGRFRGEIEIKGECSDARLSIFPSICRTRRTRIQLTLFPRSRPHNWIVSSRLMSRASRVFALVQPKSQVEGSSRENERKGSRGRERENGSPPPALVSLPSRGELCLGKIPACKYTGCPTQDTACVYIG